MKLFPKLLSLLGALAIAGGTAFAGDCDKCPGKKDKEKEESTLVAEGCKKKKKEGEEKEEGTLLAHCGKCGKDHDKKKEEEKKEGALTLLAGKDCGGCKKDKKEGEEKEEGTLLAA